jgi:hypothetical protein
VTAGEVPLDAVRQVPARLQLLKPGMSLSDALRTLGLEGLPSGTWGSGPPRNYGFRIHLSTNSILILRCDTTQESLTFLEAELFDGQMKPLRK